jgi:hypothetical protein
MTIGSLLKDLNTQKCKGGVRGTIGSLLIIKLIERI